MELSVVIGWNLVISAYINGNKITQFIFTDAETESGTK